MGKIPYVLENELFVRSEFKHAEELLAEYNDFFIYNLAQYAELYQKKDEQFEEAESVEEEKRLELAEHNSKVASEHFAGLFGSKDFAESTLVGFRPAWYDLQQILIEEFKYKTPVKDSAMNGIAPMLRNVASIMLFAERMVSGLEKLQCSIEIIAPVKEGFELLMERVQTLRGEVPEFNKNKTIIAKFKKADQYLEMCEKLFFEVK